MSPRNAPARIVLHDRFDAALFDLDGVLTDTATIHFRAWREALAMLDPSFEPLSEAEYRGLIDGRARRDGALKIAAHRGLSASPDQLAAVKNERFRALLERDGPAVLPGARALLNSLRAVGSRIGLVTASCNALFVLRACGLDRVVDFVCDGVVAAKHRLKSKPSPDLPAFCMSALAADPKACLGFEDAVSGVASLVAAQVGTIIGVGREDRALALLGAGASAVAPGLSDVAVEAL